MNTLKVIVENSCTIPMNLYSNGEELKIGETDYLVFTVRKRIEDKEYLIRRKITSDDYNDELGFYPINILPSDTQNLELNNYDDKKNYKYDVTLYNTESTDVQRTLIRGDFIVSWRASRGDDQ